MNIHEYQGKEILKAYGLPVPHGVAVRSLDEVEKATAALQKTAGNTIFVVKAQIHAGGRGAGHFKGQENEKGGVRVVKTSAEVMKNAEAMLHHTLMTKQTGASGKEVKCLYIEEGADIKAEFYLSLLIDRALATPIFVLSPAGGMNIEEVAEKTPDKIFKIPLNINKTIDSTMAAQAAKNLGLPSSVIGDMEKIMGGLFKAFVEKDCSLIEINPLILTQDNRLVLLDAKISFDDNGLFRHPDIEKLRDAAEEEPMEREAAKHDLSYIKLDGNIGCMVNGAGLAMATLDIIKQEGAAPANFLDVGGGATEERVKKAFEIILSDKNVKGILVNIFGGIMRCDIIAKGIINALHGMKDLHLPLVVRLEGTNVELGKKLLQDSGLPIITASDLGDAAKKIVKAIK